MKGINSTILSKLRDALGFETIMLLRGVGPLWPERSMKIVESSIPKKTGTIDIQEFWADISNHEGAILLNEEKWKDLRHHFNKALKLNISGDHPAIVTANDYDPTKIKHSRADLILPFLLLAIGDYSNLPHISSFLHRLLRELESFIDATESLNQQEETNNKRDNELKFYEHEISKSAQYIIEMYSKLKYLASESDATIQNHWEILRENFLKRVRNLLGKSQLPRAFAEEKYSVPDFDFQFDRKNLVQLIDESISRCASIGTSRGVLVQWKNKPSSPMYSEIDERLLAIAIDEILSNAVKFSFANNTIDVSLDSAIDHFWKISIRDFGIRVPQDKLEEVFEPGRRLMLEPEFRGKNRAERSGSGMGLAYVKAIIENHRGHVSLSCTPGRYAKMNPTSEREHVHEVVMNILLPKINQY